MQAPPSAAPAAHRRWFILDAIGPFFRGYDRHRINWSKVPFPHLDRDGCVDRARFPVIREDVRRLCEHAARHGFDAVSVDDLAHLAGHAAYPPDLRARIEAYREEYARTFDRIDSDRLVLSMKHGESDFFRYLAVNKQFFRGRHLRLVELQARHEYEGAGAFPSFIGGDYERCRNQLRAAPHLAGAIVWCRTDGWMRFRRLTFVERSPVWNEINTWVSVRLFRDGVTAAEAVESWRQAYAPHLDGARLLRLLRLSEEGVAELLYVDDFARQKFFFRRLRVPPLLSVFWDHVIVNHAMRQLLRCYVADGEAKILQARQALEKIAEMRRLVDRLFTIRLLGWIYPLLRRRGGGVLPEFSRRQAMGIDTVFK